MPRPPRAKGNSQRELVTRVVSGAGVGVASGVASALFPAHSAAFVAVSAALGGAPPAVERILTFLGQRERQRLEDATAYARQKYHENMAHGKKRRGDGFFDSFDDRTPADEVVERVLYVVRDEPQEKKVRYLSYLGTNILFHPEVDLAQANQLVLLAGRLSFRQLCLLAVIIQKERFVLARRELKPSETDPPMTAAEGAVRQELLDLQSQGLVRATISLMGVPGPDDIDPSQTLVIGIGHTLHELMELATIDRVELAAVARLLQ